MTPQDNVRHKDKWAYHPDMDPKTFIMEQHWEKYSDAEHAVWNALYERQMKILPGRAVDEYLQYIEQIGFGSNGIPNFDAVSKKLMDTTGWRIVAVPGLIPGDIFFGHLANRIFPVTYWIRKPEQMDYLPEPDLFHDLFGHVPMLMNPFIADYIQTYGKGGLKAMQIPGGLIRITRLYWYSIEFGLMRTPKGMRIYGAGIMSSKEESIYAVESPRPHRVKFDVKRMMQTDYRYFDLQETYFVIDSYDELIEATNPDFTPYYNELYKKPIIDPKELRPGDEVITQGTVIKEK